MTLLSAIKDRIAALADSASVAGIGLNMDGEGGRRIGLAVLKRKNRRIDLLCSRAGLETAAEALQGIDRSMPLCLAVDGRAVLHKKIVPNGRDAGAILQHVMPGADVSDFVIQLGRPGPDGETTVSVARKDALEKIVAEFSAEGRYVTGLYLGPSCEDNILALAAEESVRSCASQRGFAAAFSALTGAPWPAVSGLEAVARQKQEWRQMMRFRKRALAAGLFFFSALLANFFAYDSLRSANDLLSAALGSNRHILKEIESLQEKVHAKEFLLNEAGWMRPSRASLYADRLAATVPAAIQLTGLHIQPRQERRENGVKKIIYENNRLLAAGLCSESLHLNKWLKTLSALPWVAKAQVDDYRQKKAGQPPEFMISITIKP